VFEPCRTGDPGGPAAYDSQTFGPLRFQRKLLNSFGHPVPVLAGQLQIEATKASPTVLSTAFGSDGDEIKMDITSSYNVPALEKLIRTMDYSRKGTGSVTISDEVTFHAASQFEDVLITDGTWKQLDDHTILLAMGKSVLRVSIQTPTGFTVRSERVQEMGAPAFFHIGLVLNKPVTNATVTMTFQPQPQNPRP